MGRSVSDVAAILSIMAGVDSRDNYTSAIPQPIPDYTKALRPDALKGKRIGVPRKFTRPEYSSIAQVELAAFEKALGIMESLGATVVDHADLPSAEAYLNITNPVARVDFKVCNPAGFGSIS
jgi:amidase